MLLNHPNAFATCYDKYTKLDPSFERNENDDMENILHFFDHSVANPLTHFSIALHDEPAWSWALTSCNAL
jgi:hypothetical protein